MKKHGWRAGLPLLLVILLAACARFGAGAEAVDPFVQIKRLGRGVNILGYDPIWDDFHKARFKEQHFKLIHDAGFQTVRINLHALQRLRAANGYKLDEAWLKTLDWAVGRALENHLMVILDLHNYEDIAEDPQGYKPRFLAYWKQMAAHFQDAPDTVLFELLNEPNRKLTPELWSEFLSEVLPIIRATNPTRILIIGPPFWNSIDHLDELVLPEDDRNIIVTVHYYEPMRFTHQGAPWEKETAHLSGVTWGTAEEKKRVEQDFARVQDWSLKHHRPILLGEFGAYEKAPMESRALYIAHVARTAESLGWAWTYWQFDSDFIVFDIDKDRWVEPIFKALIPR
ncbi:MAG: glycoside hydrolase family 5 protein [Acidobacteriia bacterium]|nr:glycoside hydrolase family 5 protein [Terriglobia bacterium]